MPSVGPVPLTANELDAAADVLFRSFAADPGLLFVLPGSAERQRLGPILARTMLRFVLRCGVPLVTFPPVRGVALWFPPGAREPTKEDLAETGIAQVPGQIGPEPWARFKRLVGSVIDGLSPAVVADKQIGPVPNELAQANEPTNAVRLENETNIARSLGIFGSPTFVIDGEIFWGDDRFEAAIEWRMKN